MADSMRFRNFGGIHQFVVADESDLARIDKLDPARWAATSAPLADLHCDPAFLTYLDEGGSGRVRVAQIIAAREFAFERLARRVRLRERTEVLHLEDLADSDVGKTLRAAATQLIVELKLEDKTQLSLASVRAFRDGYRKTLANGDGVVPAEYLTEGDAAQLVTDIIATTGGTKDASELMGVGQAEVDRFVEKARGWLDWRAKGTAAAVWAADTEAAAALVSALDGKIEEYFWHCDLLKQESSTADTLRLKEEELRLLKAKDAAAIEKYLAESPLATPVATGSLMLGQSVNPVYRDKFEELRAKVIGRALPPGTAQLTRATWRQVKATFDGWYGWQKDKPAEPFDALGEEKVKAILDGPLPGRLAHFIGVDKAAAIGLEQVAQLEKLILYQRWLLELANNFVNFSAVYKAAERALVDMGSLVIDGRRLDFCVKVADLAAHKKIASESLLFLVYVQVHEKENAAPAYTVLAPVTGGVRGRLRVGKRGIFIDTAGKEWDAVVADIVENPISVWEAATMPFRKLGQFVGKKVEEWVGSQQAAAEKSMGDSAQSQVAEAQKKAEETIKDAKEATDGKAPATPPPAAAEPLKKEKEAEPLNVNSLVLGGGMALAGLGAVLAGVFGMLTTLSGWLAIVGAVTLVMSFSALLGWLKLRRRDMSLLFEASGWAVNIQMSINRRVSRVFTFTPELPKGAVKERFDELATKEDEGHGGLYLFLIVLLLAASIAAYYFRARLFQRA